MSKVRWTWTCFPLFLVENFFEIYTVQQMRAIVCKQDCASVTLHFTSNCTNGHVQKSNIKKATLNKLKLAKLYKTRFCTLYRFERVKLTTKKNINNVPV